MPDRSVLDRFGKDIVTRVRDEAISRFERTEKNEASMALNRLSDEERAAMRAAVIDGVDCAILQFMAVLEEESENLTLTLRTREGPKNIIELSPNLPDELHGEKGWIARFSAFEKK